MSRSHPWEVSDAWWERVIPLIPPPPSHTRGGRPRMPDRQAFAALVYVLRTGIGVECAATSTGSQFYST
jgi:putative transposase